MVIRPKAESVRNQSILLLEEYAKPTFKEVLEKY
jgi:hypothetical protein